MNVLIVGGQTVAVEVQVALQQHGHQIAGMLPSLTPAMAGQFDFQALVVVAPEAAVSSEVLRAALERGRHVFVVAAPGDGLHSWAEGVGVPVFPYPPGEKGVIELVDALKRADAGGTDAADLYRRATLGGDLAARVQMGTGALRRIVVTSPKGGTGKTTTAVNLAVLFALLGVDTCLVDADANGGAVFYHARLNGLDPRNTLIALFRDTDDGRGGAAGYMAGVVAGAAYLERFTPIPDLPTLRVLPGLVADHLGDPALQNADHVEQVMARLFEVGTAAGGVVIMDVGINPAHVVHRAALRHAEAVVIVAQPEVPDVAETRRWIVNMIGAVEGMTGSRKAALQFVGSRVRLLYNKVPPGYDFNRIHRELVRTLHEVDGLDLQITPNGVLPFVPPDYTVPAVNSNRRDDILIWRYFRDRPAELAPYAEALVNFAAGLVPVVREAAVARGLIGEPRKRRRLFFGR